MLFHIWRKFRYRQPKITEFRLMVMQLTLQYGENWLCLLIIHRETCEIIFSQFHHQYHKLKLVLGMLFGEYYLMLFY